MTKVDLIIIATVVLGFALILNQISSHIRNLWEIHLDLCRIYEVMERFFGFETGPFKKHIIDELKAKSAKTRECCLDKIGPKEPAEEPVVKRYRYKDPDYHKKYNKTHRHAFDRNTGAKRWVKKSQCHRELNTKTGKEIWVVNA